MILFNAKEYGIVSGTEISSKLMDLLEKIRESSGEKKLVFEHGTYFINSDKCNHYTLNVTNSTSDDDYDEEEVPFTVPVAIYLRNISDLVIEGNRSTFEIIGKATNFVAEFCERLSICNLEIEHNNPDVHEFQVLDVNDKSVTFALDPDTVFEVRDNKLYFYSDSRSIPANRDQNARWIGHILPDTPDRIDRAFHPLYGATSIERADIQVIKVYYDDTSMFRKGERFYLFDVRRKYCGIFINCCDNITLTGVYQRFNYGLGLVLQDTDTVTVEGCVFAPREYSSRKLVSIADFVQVCMCRGKISFRNNRFEGSGDDCINVHGIHFGIKEVLGNDIKLCFMHSKTYGFNPIHVGDTIAFIDRMSLIEVGKCNVLMSTMISDHEIVVTVDKHECLNSNIVVEDVSACPDVEFICNIMNRIVTRGLLVTTRGEISIKNNRFMNTSMSGILISDDANTWYESGMCESVSIIDNVFEFCGGTAIMIWPENTIYKGNVHRNVLIKGNYFIKSESQYCIVAKCTENLKIIGNNYKCSQIVKVEKCNNVIESDNSREP